MELLQNDKLLKIVDRLKLEFSPVKIILFGFRNQNYIRAESDFDLVVIVKSISSTRIERMERARLAIRDVDSSADVFVFTVEEFENLKCSFNSIPEIASSTGIELTVS